MPSNCDAFFCLNLVGLVQTAFWLVGGTVAILTYRQAKKSLFQPVRVEVFKLQLTVLTRIYELYAVRDEMALREKFDLEECLKYNALLMVEAYAENVFDAKPKVSVRDRMGSKFHGGIVFAGMSDLFELIGPPQTAEERSDDHRQIHKKPWSEFKPDIIETSDAHLAAAAELDILRRDPLVPTDVVKILDDLSGAVHKDLAAINDVLIESARILPMSYPSVDTMSEIDIAWIGNMWTRKAVELEAQASRLGDYIRAYLQSEEVGRTDIRKRSARARAFFSKKRVRPLRSE